MGHGDKPVFHTSAFGDCGFFGVDDGRYFKSPYRGSLKPREFSYDDLDYQPGHGGGCTIHIDFANKSQSVTQRLGLHGPELPPDFIRNKRQRIDLSLGSRAISGS